MNWLKWFKQRPSMPAPREVQHGSDQLRNFSPRAQQVLALARSEADRFHHNFVGTEHVLLGIIRLGQGTAFTVLGRMGVDLATARREVENQLGMGPDQRIIGNIPYTPRVKKALALAAKQAKELSHTYVGTEHVLLGLLREGDGVAARVLKTFKVDIDATRKEILKELDPNSSSKPDSAETSQKSKSEATEHERVDLTKRYDLYCREGDHQVVFRNVLMKGIKTLFRKREYDVFSEYIEIEQADGTSVFIARASVSKFCGHGVTPAFEKLNT